MRRISCSIHVAWSMIYRLFIFNGNAAKWRRGEVFSSCAMSDNRTVVIVQTLPVHGRSSPNTTPPPPVVHQQRTAKMIPDIGRERLPQCPITNPSNPILIIPYHRYLGM